MNKSLLFAALLFLSCSQIYAQLSVPQAEAVYGGRILGITSIPLSSTQTRVFISTESANSIFYADMNTGGTGIPSFGTFTVLPGAGSDDGFGGGISKMDAHKATSDLYFITQTGALVKTNPSSSTVTTLIASGAQAVYIVNYSDSLSYIFVIEGTGLMFGTLDSTGTLTPGTGSPLTLSGAMTNPEFYVNPSSKLLYITDKNSSAPTLFVTKNKYNTLSSSTTISSVNTSPLATGTINWTAFGIGNDGTYFFGGNNDAGKIVAYSKDGGTNWQIDTIGISGTSGPTFAFPKTGDNYSVYFASCYARFDSSSGFDTWHSFGNSGLETHPNDGIVYVDPLDTAVVYVTTDQGLGVTTNGGSVIKEIDDGITAVQINDFDMDSAKTTGWVASKSGIRRVSNYSTSPSWSLGMFPNNDGSPYYSSEMIGNDTSSAYVGNVRVYKTNDSGSNWNMLFSAENAPYNFSNGAAIEAIEVNPYDTSMVFAGYTQQGTNQGGLFFSTDGGSSWGQMPCRASSSGEDIDVKDIVFTSESGNSVAYVAAQYDPTIPSSSDRGKSVYRVEWSGTSGTVRQDMNYSYTSSGQNITATINDLALSATNDTLFAAGQDSTGSKPVVYYKVITGTNLWTELPVAGITPDPNGIKAITAGKDTLYCSVNNNVYIMDLSSASSWLLGYSYPAGDAINVLYFDDLLVGTGTGLYGQFGKTTTAIEDQKTIPDKYALFQNYPNPFNPSTKIRFNIPQTNFVQLKIYNVLGQEVSTPVNKVMEPGTHEINFNASTLASGFYFYQIKAGNYTEVKKMILLK